MDPTISALLLALFAAVVGYYLGLDRHRRESNWRLKQDAYVDLVVSLQLLLDYYRMREEESHGFSRYSDDYLNAQGDKANAAGEKLDRCRAMALVLLGTDISKALEELDSVLASRRTNGNEWAAVRVRKVEEVLALVQKRAAAEMKS